MKIIYNNIVGWCIDRLTKAKVGKRPPMSYLLGQLKSMDGFYILNIDSTGTTNITITTFNVTEDAIHPTQNSIRGKLSNGQTFSLSEGGHTYSYQLSPGEWMKVTMINSWKCPNIKVTGADAVVFGNLAVTRSYTHISTKYYAHVSYSGWGTANFGGRFQGLFKGSTALKYAHNLYIDRHSGTSAYKEMFMNCSNLVTSPLFRTATSSFNGTFKDIFSGCNKLENAWIASPDYDLTAAGIRSGCTLHYNNNNTSTPSGVTLDPVLSGMVGVRTPDDVVLETPGGSYDPISKNFEIGGIYSIGWVLFTHSGENYWGNTLDNREDADKHVYTYDGGRRIDFPDILLDQERNLLKYTGGRRYQGGERTCTMSFGDVFDRRTSYENLTYALEYDDYIVNWINNHTDQS